MSWVSNPDQVLSSGWLSSAYAGLGILGSNIPTSGDNGGSPVLNDGVSSTKEYRWELVTGPSAGTLTLYEDLTFEFSHTSDVIISFVYRLYEDGASVGTATVNLQIGPSHVVISATTSLPGFSGSASVDGTPAEVTISTTTALPTFSGSAGQSASAAIAAATGLPVFAGGATSGSLTDSQKLDLILVMLSGLPTAESIAAAILAAAQITPIYSDIRKVRGQTVVGSGSEVDPWGP